MLTQNYLKEILDYCPDTGTFTWKQLCKNTRKTKVGDRAGGLMSDGYWRICIKNKTYKAHRLVWLYTHGVWPKEQLDHINGIRHDNRLINLREVSARENLQNYECHRNGKLVGACYKKQINKWQASIYINKTQKHLGYFKTELEAHQAYMEANLALAGLVGAVAASNSFEKRGIKNEG